MLDQHHHFFFPSPLPGITPTAREQDRHHYVYGWEYGTVVVVAGAVEAASVEQAEQQLVVKRIESDRVSLIGRLSRGVDGEKKAAYKNGGMNKMNGVKNRVKELRWTVNLAEDGTPSITDWTHSHVTPILYTQPSRTNYQFFSLTPLQLDLNSFSTPSQNEIESDNKDDDGAEAKERVEAEVLSDKIRALKELDFSGVDVPAADLERVVNWLNLAPVVAGTICPTPPPFRKPSLPQIPSFCTALLPILLFPFHLVALFAKALVSFANTEIPWLGGTAPKDFSSTVHQIDTRLSQALSWSRQYKLIRKTTNTPPHQLDSSALAAGTAHYIQFYNTLWLIANDVIVGTAFTSFFCENSEAIGIALGDAIEEYTLKSLRELLLWLNDWPGGVKLNFELASVFCDAFLWGTGLWEELIFTPLRHYLPTLVYLVGLSGLVGTSMFMAVSSDLLAVLTMHLFVFYYLITCLFRWHLSMLGALFNIFRGKKYNKLRHRVEPASYSVDQLLLGTILFNLAGFLFPTVLAYYLAFATARLAIVGLHAAMETILAFMNHFPLFAVMLRFKDSGRLPGGLQLELKVSKDGQTAYLQLKNNPIHLARIFFQHLQLSRRLASHYSPIYLLGRLFTGRVISPIPRVRLRLWVDVNPSNLEK
ncbi:Gpi1-domain-containing protein [Meredithblackwellia eburnea MCA 4105]